MFSFVSGAVTSGLNAIKRISGSPGINDILEAFSTVGAAVLDAAGLNFGQDYRDIKVSFWRLKDASYLLVHRRYG